MKYADLYRKSIQNPLEFWERQAAEIKWYQDPQTVYSKDEDGLTTWFDDGLVNMSYLCLDRHIEEGYGQQVALIYDSPVSKTVRRYTFKEVLSEVSRLAGGLQDLGVVKGDTVIIYMPMIPQAVFAMLACARIGAIHSVVFGGFAPHELAIRIDDCAPKAIITASNGIEVQKIIEYKPIVDAAIEEASHKPDHVILFNRKQGVNFTMTHRDHDYQKVVDNAQRAEPVPLPSTHPLYILYTSGTTGKPKGVLRDTGGYATALMFSMKYLYDAHPGDTYWAASDIGWVVGHSYIVYGPLLNRNTTVLFEGKPVKTPDASTFWRVISDHDVRIMFTAPTAIRAIKREDPNGELLKGHKLGSLKYLFLAGERCDEATLHWCEKMLGVPVIDHWWQTESGWPMISNMPGIELLPVKPGSASVPVPGYDIRIVNEQGREVQRGQSGYIVVKLPLPPGNLTTLWGNPQRFQHAYFERFPGYYFSGDAGFMDEDGYVFITGRVDDIINVAGHRLSTGEMEEVVASHPSVAECAVFGVEDDLKGQIPVGVVILKAGSIRAPETVQKEIVGLVREKIGPVASFKKVHVAQRLPKTRSGKILRNLLRDVADGKEHKIPSTIEDPGIVSELEILFGAPVAI